MEKGTQPRAPVSPLARAAPGDLGEHQLGGERGPCSLPSGVAVGPHTVSVTSEQSVFHKRSLMPGCGRCQHRPSS